MRIMATLAVVASLASLMMVCVWLSDTRAATVPDGRCVAAQRDDGLRGWFCDGTFLVDNSIKSR